jgi:acyl-CoA thioesterase FadM
MQMLNVQGYTEMNAGGNSMIMADVMIAYKGEAFYGDKLTIKIYAQEVSAYSFDLLYHITTMRDSRQADIAHAKTGMVCFNYETRKIANMTEQFRTFLTGGKPQ